MNTQKIMRLADIYAERCNDHQRHATEETHHDMMLFRKALEAEANRLHESVTYFQEAYGQELKTSNKFRSVNAELLDALKKVVGHIHWREKIQGCLGTFEEVLPEAEAAIAKAQE